MLFRIYKKFPFNVSISLFFYLFLWDNYPTNKKIIKLFIYEEIRETKFLLEKHRDRNVTVTERNKLKTT